MKVLALLSGGIDSPVAITTAKHKGFEVGATVILDWSDTTPKYGRISALNTTVMTLEADVGDLRESPALVIKKILEKKGAKVITFDPYIESDVKSLEELQSKTDVIILATNHKSFENIDFSKVKVFVDGRNMFHDSRPKNCIYKGIGVK